jgi:mono/diheme cytochrome c family protein
MPCDHRPHRRRGPRLVLRWACAIAASLALSSCGGRAADGVEPETSVPGAVTTADDEPTVVRPIRETCDDNPLLAGCPYANTGGTSPPPRTPREPSSDIEPQYVAAARNVLDANCGACHGPELTELQASGAINYIDDWNQLIQAGLIEPCEPESSRIIEVMRTGEMPPARSGQNTVTDADVSVVVVAIELDCMYR